ncbi:MAG: hypothetical protein J2P45_15570, partial [Candidatus Dormibacteraeota bacterium]|nr:hypothetical protein [Candidatus Dormibacteraeota bacterium]
MSGLQEQLAERVEAGDIPGLLDLLAPLGESERAALADGARTLYEEVMRDAEAVHQERVRRAAGGSPLLQHPSRHPSPRVRAAVLAWLATGDNADLLPAPESDWAI